MEIINSIFVPIVLSRFFRPLSVGLFSTSLLNLYFNDITIICIRIITAAMFIFLFVINLNVLN